MLRTKILSSIFFKRVLTVLSGSVLAQIISLGAAPILTRLFTPEQFGILSIFLGAIAMLGIVSTLRFENAVLLPESENDAAAIVATVITCSAVFSAVLTLVLLIAGNTLLAWSNMDALTTYWYLLPAGVFLMGITQGLNAWKIRLLQFNNQAFARISQAAATVTLQMIAGIMRLGEVGLLIGQLIGQLTNTLVLILARKKTLKPIFQNLRVDRVVNMMKVYQRFPKYSLPADFANSLSNYLPYLLIGMYFGSLSVGLYAMTQRVLSTPISMVGTAILDVFKEKAATDYKKEGNCRPIFRKVLGIMAVISLIPTLIIIVWGPEIFAFVFGQTWGKAGVYAQILAPLFFIRFIASPLGYTLYISQKQNVDMYWQIVLLAVTVLSIGAGAVLGSEMFSIAFFSAGYTAMYLIYIVLSYYYAKSVNAPDKNNELV